MKDFKPEWIRRNKWLLLLLGIISMLLISPVSEVYARQDNIISPVAAVVLMAVTLGAAEKRRTIVLVGILIMFWLIISTLTEGSGLFARESRMAPLLFMIILATIFLLLVRWLIRVVHINREVLCAVVCGYLIIGIFWTSLYSFVVAAFPDALVSATGASITLSDQFYFSFITLTTTGYGDIVPKNPIVRMLTVMEAVVGTFYNAIVIARFVALYGMKLER